MVLKKAYLENTFKKHNPNWALNQVTHADYVSDILRRNVNTKVSALCHSAAFSAQRASPAACLQTGPVEILEGQPSYFFEQCIYMQHDCKHMHVCWLMYTYWSHAGEKKNKYIYIVKYSQHRLQTRRWKYK